MQIKLNFTLTTPLTQQISQQIAQQIESGALLPGAALPTVRQLSRELGVHFNTVARAYRQLRQAGLVWVQVGRGSRVRPSPLIEHQARRADRASLAALADAFIHTAQASGYTKADILECLQERCRPTE
jgi:DNA-binding transcriptional regulator YhcF (GntR family)